MHTVAQRLGSTSKWALGMRLRHLAVTSAESRTILVQVSSRRPDGQSAWCCVLVDSTPAASMLHRLRWRHC